LKFQKICNTLYNEFLFREVAMNNKLVIGVIVAVVVAVAAYFIMENAGTDNSADSGTGGALMRTNQTEGPVEIGSKTVDIELINEFETYGQAF
jgi:hypothetical protein